jgi:hypothetical protein
MGNGEAPFLYILGVFLSFYIFFLTKTLLHYKELDNLRFNRTGKDPKTTIETRQHKIINIFHSSHIWDNTIHGLFYLK